MPDAILPFNTALERARAARTEAERTEVMRDVSRRLHAANSALAVDSAAQIVDALLGEEA